MSYQSTHVQNPFCKVENCHVIQTNSKSIPKSVLFNKYLRGFSLSMGMEVADDDDDGDYDDDHYDDDDGDADDDDVDDVDDG